MGRFLYLPLCLGTAALAACGSSSPVANSGSGSTAAAPQTQYDMANACFGLKALTNNDYAVKNSDGSYSISAATLAGGEPFFMKPTGLGSYMFYAKDQSYLAASGGVVNSAGGPSTATDWTVTAPSPGVYNIANAAAGESLAVDPATGKLILAAAPASFGFTPDSGCTPYPEAQLNVTGTTYKGRGVDQPILGFADVHNHISATDFLGGAHYGVPWHKYGITEALKDCQDVHGVDGTKDLIGNLEGYNTPIRPHDTVGWPTFTDWPAAKSLTHEGMYYRWLERTWMAGLRLIVTNVVENQALCSLESIALGRVGQNCNEMDSAVSQIQFLRDMQDYVDAQEGGPGKGWFRIVESPAEARQVINDGKLAVVMGVEISHLFNCDEKLGVPGCSEADIDTQLDRLYNLGIREMFSIHEFNNAFGGNGIFDGFILNVGNFYDTGQFWATYDCPTGPYLSPMYNYTGGAVMTTSIPSDVTNPIVQMLDSVAGGVLPLYPDTRQCNARGLTDLGRYAFQEMMKKKIVMDVDHLELSIKGDLISMGEAQNPPYPVISAHGGHGGLTLDQAQRIINSGGLIYPIHDNGANWVKLLNSAILPLKNPKYTFAMGYGADTNGLALQAEPRGAGSTPVSYPFTLFQGSDWGPQFAGIAPLSFDRQVTGQRTFDINKEGSAHYGLKADFVEEVRIEGGQPALDALYNSAEAYVEMWERTVNR